MSRPSIHDRRPELSQHFFRDQQIARRLAASLPIRTRTVLEFGPGTGILTDALADAGFRVIAIEKDPRLFRSLRQRMIGRTNVECHHGDFLRSPLPVGDFTVVANVPFNITAATVRRLTMTTRPPRDCFLVLQREAAQKFAGVPRETLFSLLIKPSFEASIVRLLRRMDFDPPPRVRPALLWIHRRDAVLLSGARAAQYRRFVSELFGDSRPCRVALKRYFTRRQIVRLAHDRTFALCSRPSALSFPQWLDIFRCYEHVCMGRDPTVRCEQVVTKPGGDGAYSSLPPNANRTIV